MRKKEYPSYSRSTPQAASNVLAKTLAAYRLDKKVEEYSAFPHWPEIVGEEISRVAVPEKIIRGKILVVRVLDSAWAQELSMRKIELLQKIYARGMSSSIEDIRFITGNPAEIKSR